MVYSHFFTLFVFFFAQVVDLTGLDPDCLVSRFATHRRPTNQPCASPPPLALSLGGPHCRAPGTSPESSPHSSPAASPRVSLASDTRPDLLDLANTEELHTSQGSRNSEKPEHSAGAPPSSPREGGAVTGDGSVLEGRQDGGVSLAAMLEASNICLASV